MISSDTGDMHFQFAKLFENWHRDVDDVNRQLRVVEFHAERSRHQPEGAGDDRSRPAGCHLKLELDDAGLESGLRGECQAGDLYAALERAPHEEAYKRQDRQRRKKPSARREVVTGQGGGDHGKRSKPPGLQVSFGEDPPRQGEQRHARQLFCDFNLLCAAGIQQG